MKQPEKSEVKPEADSVSGDVYKLRSESKTLSEYDAEAMVKKHNFYDRGWNKSGSFKNDFKDNRDGTITDRVTGLVWEKAGSSNTMSLSYAQSYIQSLNQKKFAGYSDWRLPTLEEIASLLESGLFIDHLFDGKQWWCWTADKRAYSGAWGVDFYRRIVSWDDVNRSNYVRAVRSWTVMLIKKHYLFDLDETLMDTSALYPSALLEASMIKLPCDNIRHCNENVHNIIYNMLQGRCDKYRGRKLFGGEYSIFEGDDCIQYLQEYVPFHLPQIEYALRDTLRNYPFTHNHVSILDIGSGPATVALSLCKMDEAGYYDFSITTIEASNTFNNMIEIYERINLNRSVTIVENLKYTFEDFFNLSCQWEGHFDWIIIANFVTGIDDYMKLNELVTNLLHSEEKVLLTIIETGTLQKYIKNLEFDNLKIENISYINEQIDAEWLSNCKFYRTNPACPKYRPYINSKSLLLERK
ncbi:MAG: DUF1566 domain-containing protein [Desulfobacteraceae bacterium]|nr:DUF1566 domain-containing protein [Desulfobacteraceae bacterium]